MNQNENPLEPSRLIWFGLIALCGFGLGIVFLRPPEEPIDAMPTPGPSPEIASLQCLDGKTFRSVDEVVAPAREDGFAMKGRWTVTFATGSYVLDQVGTREAGSYRCDGQRIHASSALGSHRAQLDPSGARLAWDGQGFELVTDATTTPGLEPSPEPVPKTATTSG